MSSGKMLRLTLLGLAFIVLIAGLLIFSRLMRQSSSEIALPPVADASNTGAEELPAYLDTVVVSKTNVQKLIADTLTRPEAYSREIMVESFWDEGSNVERLNVSVRDGVTSVRTFFGGTAKYIVVTDEYRYIWYAGDSAPAKLKTPAAGDEYQKIITYEDILELDTSRILGAGFINDANGPGIFVRYLSGSFGYVTEARVSIELGLVTGAEQYDGDKLVYRMSAGQCNLDTPGDTAFILPDGVNTLE